MNIKNRIIKARKVLETYYIEHKKLHSNGWYKNINKDHEPLIKKRRKEFKKLGFNSFEEFEEINENFLLQENIENFKKYTSNKKFSLIESSEENPSKIVSSFEMLIPNTLLFVNTPKMIYLGKNADLKENVKISLCKNNVSVIRGILEGRGYFYDKNDAIFVILSTKKEIPYKLFQEILENSIKNLNYDVEIINNDLRFNNSRIGMTAPTSKLKNKFIIGAEILLKTDHDLVQKYLKFPKSKWINKPVNNIKKWTKGLNTISKTNHKNIKNSIVQEFKKNLNILIEKREFTTQEIKNINNTYSKKYKSLI